MADDLTPQDRDLITRTVLSEAGQDGAPGMQAVAAVIKNRIDSGQYGASASDVVLAPHQFSAWSLPRNDPNNPSRWSTKNPQYQQAASLVDSIWSGKTPDPTGGADHYLNPVLVKAQTGTLPDWAQGKPSAQIGRHTFFAPNGPATPDLLGSWNAPPATASAPATTISADTAPDLLGSWKTGVPEITSGSTSPIRITIHPQNAVAPDTSLTAPQWTNLELAQHQGDDWADRGIRLGLGALRGVGDVADTLAEGIAATGRAGAGALQSVGALSPVTAGHIEDWASGIDRGVSTDRDAFNAISANSPLAQFGRIGGQVAATAPFLSGAGALIDGATGIGGALTARPMIRAALTGAGAGGGAAALTAAASDEPLINQIQGGALSGGVLGPVGYGMAKLGENIFGKAVDPAIAALAQTARQSGINLGAGDISSNPMVRFASSVIDRMPFTGGVQSVAQKQTALNRNVAAEMGVQADKITPAILQQAKSNAYAAYDAAKQNLGPLKVDNGFFGDLQNIYDNAHFNLETPQAKAIDKHLVNVLNKVNSQSWTMDPDLYQSLTRKNGPLDNAINSRDSKISSYASNIKDALENLVTRNDPTMKVLKDQADYKYFVAKSLEDGPINLISPSGDVSPAALYGAVKGSSTRIGTLGQIGRQFMREPPSSGTAERAFILEHLPQLVLGATGLSGLGAATYFEPESWQRNILLGLGTAGLARAVGGTLRGNTRRGSMLANAMIRSGLNPGGVGSAQKALQVIAPTAGALIARPSALPQTP